MSANNLDSDLLQKWEELPLTSEQKFLLQTHLEQLYVPEKGSFIHVGNPYANIPLEVIKKAQELYPHIRDQLLGVNLVEAEKPETELATPKEEEKKEKHESHSSHHDDNHSEDSHHDEQTTKSPQSAMKNEQQPVNNIQQKSPPKSSYQRIKEGLKRNNGLSPASPESEQINILNAM